MSAQRPCRPIGRRPRPGYRASRLVRHRRVRLTADVRGGPPVTARRFSGGYGGHPAPARVPPKAWVVSRPEIDLSGAERPERGGLVATLIVVLVVAVASTIGGTYLWRRHHAPPMATPAACAVAEETLLQGRALTADAVTAAAWRVDRDAAHQHITEPYLQVPAGRYAAYAERIATGVPAQPTEAEKAAVVRELTAHCRQQLAVGWPTP